ncbi:MAG: hypothetical protein R3C61_05490 [Bacteroidia bacterium]
MTEAELKLTLFRWIDQLSGDSLRRLFKLVGKSLKKEVDEPLSLVEEMQTGYAAMVADKKREAEANEWIEGVLNHEDL